jgi:hypothetical protein
VGKVTRGHGEIPKYEMRTRSVSPPGRTDNAQHWGGALKRSAINLILSATLYKTRGHVGKVTRDACAAREGISGYVDKGEMRGSTLKLITSKPRV